MPIVEGGRFSPENRIVSPGVFTREIDQSGIAQGVAEIGGVVVAPFAKGPGFSPTLCNTVAELHQKFGVPDGTLYGPYTATQYLQEKGFVTVCRVGALTGYHQKYPWFIWAENGTWTRTIDRGWTDPTASFIYMEGAWFSGTANTSYVAPEIISDVISDETRSIHYTSSFGNTDAGVISVSYSSSFEDGDVGHTASYFTTSYYGSDFTGKVVFPYVPIQIKLMPDAVGASEDFFPNITASWSIPHDGSTLYNGQVIAGILSASFEFNGTLNVLTASVNSESIVNAIINEHKLVGDLDILSPFGFLTSAEPFDQSYFSEFATVQISQSVDFCNRPTLNFLGLLEGPIGPYDGQFVPGSNVSYDQCLQQWVGSGSAYKVLAVLADTAWSGVNTKLESPGFLGSIQSYNPSVSGSEFVNHQFDLQLSQSLDGGYGTYHFSIDPNDPQYITNVFGKNPQAGRQDLYARGTKKEAAYIYKIFEDDIATIVADPVHWKVNGTVMPSGSWIDEPLQFTDQWSLDLLNGDSEFSLTNAYTPWVISQQISPWNGGAPTRFPLFRFATLADGTDTNTQFKIEINTVKLAGTVAGSEWGTFNVVVREYSDTDKRPKILEQYPNCNLDPTSPDFIARRIGDRYNYIRYDGKIIEFGTYENLSKNIRVEMASNPYPVTSVPYGFQAYATPVNGQMGNWCNPMAYAKASLYGLFPGKYASGIDFNGPPVGADAELTSLYPTSSAGVEHWRDNQQYFAPIPAQATSGQNTIFALDEVITENGVGTGSYLDSSLNGVIPSIYDAANETTYVKMRKFVFGFQGGFSGQSPAIHINTGADITAGNTQGLNCANSTTAGSIAYRQCIGALGNSDEFDINLIVTPGIIYSLHTYVVNLTIEMCEARGDCFYIVDLYQDDGNPTAGQIDEVVSLASELDTSYAGTYYPWVKIKDTNINQIVTVPPSVVMPAVYAANDRVAGEWWAAAGLNRGGIQQAKQVTDRTTHLERDTLYEGRVNPIAAFPGQGIVAWGQKTLQVKASALDRINVRRLLIEIKKFFASTARYLVFEQNTAQTRNKFLAIVNPYLESVQQRSGLYAFQVVMDDSNNTPDLIDRNILYGQIYLKPTRAAEFIILDFNILPTGVSMPNG
ncbi:MAG TPA: phage tail sheath subtilisin-like domain-containing protein [Bacteroidales bacterium]|nr:phage tail sheath subtilisin-like domain-containing protein [Bacteroidales bacterium]